MRTREMLRIGASDFIPENVLEDLIDELPHGSGVDGDWSWEKDEQGNYIFYNSYHMMNEHGMYCGWVDFHVHLKASNKTVLHPLTGPLEGSVQIVQSWGDLLVDIHGFREDRHYGISDMLYEQIWDSLKRIPCIVRRHIFLGVLPKMSVKHYAKLLQKNWVDRHRGFLHISSELFNSDDTRFGLSLALACKEFLKKAS